jgi:hypothetical protein
MSLLDELLEHDSTNEWKDLFVSSENGRRPSITHSKENARHPSIAPSISRRLSLDSILPNAEDDMNAYSDDDSDMSDILMNASAACDFFDTSFSTSGTSMFPTSIDVSNVSARHRSLYDLLLI